MTATATQKAKLDIVQTLRMNNCEIFSQSFNRTNLWYCLNCILLLSGWFSFGRYEVRKKTKTALDDIISWINTNHRGKSGIIYCLSQADCEKVATKLTEKGLSADYYHAGEGNEERSDKQSEWYVIGRFSLCSSFFLFSIIA
jgi:bloom syndrome protein